MMNETTQCTKRMRAEFKAKYPGVKVSIRSPHYGAARIVWAGGPEWQEVNAWADARFAYGEFNPVDDSYNITAPRDGLPRVKWVSCIRDEA